MAMARRGVPARSACEAIAGLVQTIEWGVCPACPRTDNEGSRHCSGCVIPIVWLRWPRRCVATNLRSMKRGSQISEGSPSLDGTFLFDGSTSHARTSAGPVATVGHRSRVSMVAGGGPQALSSWGALAGGGRPVLSRRGGAVRTQRTARRDGARKGRTATRSWP